MKSPSMIKRLFWIAMLVSSWNVLMAQSQIKDTVLDVVMVHLDYSFQVPAGDIADRFGVSSYIGGGFTFKIKKNYLLGIEGGGIIGNNVKEDNVLDGLTNANGNIVGINGLLADIGIFERGFMVKAKFGKIIPTKRPNPNSGFTFLFGIGALQHKVKFQVDEGLVPQLDKDHQPGYDRLTNGLVLSQFIGYTYLSSKKGLSFYAGFEINEAFTKHRRKWDFNANKPGGESNNDFLYGVKIGWLLPFYLQATEKYYYY